MEAPETIVPSERNLGPSPPPTGGALTNTIFKAKGVRLTNPFVVLCVASAACH